jgi:hypothetical protein
MKQFFMIIIYLMGLFGTLPSYAINQVSVQIKFQQAKSIYNAMTGPAVQTEGAAGHIYKPGKSIVCIYTNADMDDTRGHSIPPKDPRRYNCKMKFNYNGLATSAI